MTIKVLLANDEAVLARIAPGVFDDALNLRATREFLNDPRHHLVVAVEDSVVIGFASAVHYVHPDKPRPELWINEIGVASSHRGRGVGKAILQSLLDLGQKLGCAEAWVLTEHNNHAAMRLYRATGGSEAAADGVMFTFRLASGDS